MRSTRMFDPSPRGTFDFDFDAAWRPVHIRARVGWGINPQETVPTPHHRWDRQISRHRGEVGALRARSTPPRSHYPRGKAAARGPRLASLAQPGQHSTLNKAPYRTHGNWSVAIGRSPLLWHGYNQTIIRHLAHNKHFQFLGCPSHGARNIPLTYVLVE